MNTFKEQCIELRKKDHTLAEIMEMTGRPKTSVYFHIRDIQLSEKKKREIREKNRDFVRQVALKRKGKSARSFLTFSKWDAKTVRLVAHLSFDGEIKWGRCAYYNRSKKLIRTVTLLMKDVYQYPPKERKNKTTGVYTVGYHNVALAAYLQKKSNELFTEAPYLSRHLKKEFLKAFFDDEGCMDYRPKDNRRAVRGYQKDVRVLFLVQNLLDEFGIESRFKKPNEVVIVGKENLKRFQKEINFSPGVCVNGKRTNSTWKKNLEKRKLLEMAINSFQK